MGAMTALDEMSPGSYRGFWNRVVKPTDPGGCWQWTGAKSDTGYGRFTYVRADGRALAARAHRIAWELEGREIPEGLELDHLCKNRLCVNPNHLEPVTARVNAQRTAKFVGGHIERREMAAGTRWRVAWREEDPATGRNVKKSKTFTLEADAETFVATRRQALAAAS